MSSEEKTAIQISTLDGVPQEIDEMGSLGLLALGYRGLLAWREKRAQIKSARNANKELPNK